MTTGISKPMMSEMLHKPGIGICHGRSPTVSDACAVCKFCMHASHVSTQAECIATEREVFQSSG